MNVLEWSYFSFIFLISELLIEYWIRSKVEFPCLPELRFMILIEKTPEY
jgi:hypothetical protein